MGVISVIGENWRSLTYRIPIFRLEVPVMKPLDTSQLPQHRGEVLGNYIACFGQLWGGETSRDQMAEVSHLKSGVGDET
jgi:hypothetical protein